MFLKFHKVHVVGKEAVLLVGLKSTSNPTLLLVSAKSFQVITQASRTVVPFVWLGDNCREATERKPLVLKPFIDGRLLQGEPMGVMRSESPHVLLAQLDGSEEDRNIVE